PFPFETVPIGSAVPPKMKAAVMRALAKDRAQRQQSVKDFFDEFTMGASRASLAFGPVRSSVPDTGFPGGGYAPVPVLGSAPTIGAGPLPAYQSGEHYASNPGMGAGPGLYPSSPGMAVPAGAYPGAPQVPMPPPPAARKSSSAALFGAL